MKLYRKIDINGLFIEDVLLEEIPHIYDEDFNKIYDPKYIETPVPQGLYKPKWTGSKWVEGMPQEEIDTIKNQPIEQPLDVRNRADIDYMSLMLGVDL